MISRKNDSSIAAQYTLSSPKDIARELIYNSIDAKATKISIQMDLEHWKIKVEDNGIRPFSSLESAGNYYISPSHSESSIYGFRGRSLYLISQVCQELRIYTKLRKEFVVKVMQRNGLSSIRRSPSRIQGTIVEIYDIFSMIPMRRNMINIKSEISRLKRLLEELSLIHISIEFRLEIDNSSSILIWKASKNLLESFEEKFKKKISQNAVVVSKRFPTFEIEGFYQAAAVAKKFVFINHTIQETDSLLFTHINDIIKRYLKDADFLFHLMIPNNEIDRNVADGGFMIKNQETLLQYLSSCFAKVEKRIALSDSTSTSGSKSRYWSSGKQSNSSVIKIPSSSKNKTFSKHIWINPIFKTSKAIQIRKPQKLETAKIQISRADFNRFQLISQIDRKFIAFKLDNLLILLDQHAVDERIKLEENMKYYMEGNSSQNDHHEFLVKFDTFLISALNQYGNELATYGFQYKRPVRESSVSKGLSVTLTRRFMHVSDPSKLFFECIEWLHSSQSIIPSQIPTPILNHFKSKACRSAIMFGDKLSYDECNQLFENLKGCKTPFQCAHGRPSLVPITLL